MKVLTNTSSRYPDLSVSFDDRELPDATSTRYPTLGPKSDEYRTIDTPQEYVTIDSRKRWAQTMRRSGEQWIVSLPITEAFLAFESVGAVVSFDELYAGTGLYPRPGNRQELMPARVRYANTKSRMTY